MGADPITTETPVYICFRMKEHHETTTQDVVRPPKENVSRERFPRQHVSKKNVPSLNEENLLHIQKCPEYATILYTKGDFIWF